MGLCRIQERQQAAPFSSSDFHSPFAIASFAHLADSCTGLFSAHEQIWVLETDAVSDYSAQISSHRPTCFDIMDSKLLYEPRFKMLMTTTG